MIPAAGRHVCCQAQPVGQMVSAPMEAPLEALHQTTLVAMFFQTHARLVFDATVESMHAFSTNAAQCYQLGRPQDVPNVAKVCGPWAKVSSFHGRTWHGP